MKAKFVIAIAVAVFLGINLVYMYLPKEGGVLDAELFAQEFTKVDENNVFRVANTENILSLLEDGNNAIFFCQPSSEWCQTYAALLNEVAVSHEIETIYYYDVVANQEQNGEVHQSLVKKLSPNLQYDPQGVKQLYVPDTIFIVKGEVVGNDWTTSVDTNGLDSPDAYWTTDRIAAWKEKIGAYFDKLKD